MASVGTDPQWQFQDERLKRLCQDAWSRLPNGVKVKARRFVEKVSDCRNSPGGSAAREFGRFSPNEKEVELFADDCAHLSEVAIMGVFVHEVAHAFESAVVPDHTDPCYADRIHQAGDALPGDWGFATEITALMEERARSR